MRLQPLCAGCGKPLPDVESGEMVMGVPGVGTFHSTCGEHLTWRQWLMHRFHRLLTRRSSRIDLEVTA
jgi:hypothetical protein